jgi:ABC-type bacteriocin/lantibiotic exporter with double-glycine peptidase domain
MLYVMDCLRQVVSIVGGSGSGKSTLGALLCRLYDVSAGSIKLDGTSSCVFSVALLGCSEPLLGLVL